MVKNIINITNIIRTTAQIFKSKNIATYRIDAEILIAYILKISRVQLYTQIERILKKNEIKDIKKITKRRCEYEPLAYILGYKEFYNNIFLVNSNVLIPRPETELLIEEICKINLNNKKILDIGTGSGNIGITIKSLNSNSIVTCSDISEKALVIAEKNAINILKDINNIKFIHSDLFDNINERFDCIISNPPYITNKEMKDLSPDVKNYEPYFALNCGDEGLHYYELIFSNIHKYLNPGGYIFLEINPIFKDQLVSLIKNANFKLININKDYSNHYRIAAAKYEI